MYNRYIPQADGSYRRTRIQDPAKPPKQRIQPCPEPAPAIPKPILKPDPEPPKLRQKPDPEPPKPKPQHHGPNDTSITSFVHKLLPKDFDTGDLLVILLLLLISADCAEDQNTAILTLALYFFM